MKWIPALKIWNAQHNPSKWCVPRKGSPEHAEVRRIMAEGGAARDTLREEEERMARSAPARSNAAPVVVEEEIDMDAVFRELTRGDRLAEIGKGLKKEKVKAFLKKALAKLKAKKPVPAGPVGAGAGGAVSAATTHAQYVRARQERSKTAAKKYGLKKGTIYEKKNPITYEQAKKIYEEIHPGQGETFEQFAGVKKPNEQYYAQFTGLSIFFHNESSIDHLRKKRDEEEKPTEKPVPSGPIGAGGGGAGGAMVASNLTEKNIVAHMKAYESSAPVKQAKDKRWEETQRSLDEYETLKNTKEGLLQDKQRREARSDAHEKRLLEGLKKAGIPQGEKNKVTLSRLEFMRALEKALKTETGYDDIGMSFVIPGRKTKAGSSQMAPIFFIENKLLKDPPSTTYSVYYAQRYLHIEKNPNK